MKQKNQKNKGYKKDQANQLNRANQTNQLSKLNQTGKINPLNLPGNTSLIDLSVMPSISRQTNYRLFAKLEGENPAGSVKDRSVYEILRNALEGKEITNKTTVAELTTGNTGVALAWAASLLQLKCQIIGTSQISEEKQQQIQSYGGNFFPIPDDVITEGSSAIFAYYANLVRERGWFSLDQCTNPLFADAYQQTIVPEIMTQLAEHEVGRLDTLLAGVGTGSTLVGVGRGLLRYFPNLEIIGVEPEQTTHGWEPIEGLRNTTVAYLGKADAYQKEVVTTTMYRTLDQAAAGKEILAEQGIIASPSSGAVLSAALEYAEKQQKKNILLLSCDGKQVKFNENPEKRLFQS